MVTQRRPAQRGFTLIEMMVVVAIIGVLMAIAVMSVRSDSYAGTVDGYARQIAAEVDAARMRAVATGRYQQLEVDANGEKVIHWEATTQGMGAPVGWEMVRRLTVPRNVLIVATDDITHLSAGHSPPSEGDGMPLDILFPPDGSGQSATLFLRNAADDDRRRVSIFRATGTAYVFKHW